MRYDPRREPSWVPRSVLSVRSQVTETTGRTVAIVTIRELVGQKKIQ